MRVCFWFKIHWLEEKFGKIAGEQVIGKKDKGFLFLEYA